ncbi:hypothetical protein Cni_G17573 [Canna indica]|uniref:SLL1 protein n=1 Tax=Canna indica TaxID=4628 RepID=A0AAQ3QHV8_9LILI|nr:hypothetical protein Cni_G17573 [Canna indica]
MARSQSHTYSYLPLTLSHFPVSAFKLGFLEKGKRGKLKTFIDRERVHRAIAMALNRGIRSGIKLFASSEASLSKSVTREFHATGVKRMGGHGHDEPYYLHTKHMYNLDRMKHQKLKMAVSVLACVSIGVAVPVYAVMFQQKKTASA